MARIKFGNYFYADAHQVSGTGITEELKILTKVAVEMNLKEAVKFLSNHL